MSDVSRKVARDKGSQKRERLVTKPLNFPSCSRKSFCFPSEVERSVREGVRQRDTMTAKLPQSYLTNTQTFRGAQMCGHNNCSFGDVTTCGRGWRKYAGKRDFEFAVLCRGHLTFVYSTTLTPGITSACQGQGLTYLKLAYNNNKKNGHFHGATFRSKI